MCTFSHRVSIGSKIDETVGKLTNRVINELHDLYTILVDSNAAIPVVKIGELLNDTGGFQLMRTVHEQFCGFISCHGGLHATWNRCGMESADGKDKLLTAPETDKKEKNMNRKNLVTIAAMMFAGIISLAMIGCGGQGKSNGVFEIINCSNNSVELKAVVETKFYSLAMISGDETFEAKMFSNSVDTVRWVNGSRFFPGSTMDLPAAYGVGAMTLPAGTVLKVFGFSAPENFKAEKIRLITEGTTEMVYDVSKSSWKKSKK
jgi:hypothetical protein